MARTVLARTQMVPFDGTAAADEFKVVEGAADVANGNSFVHTGREIITLRVSGASARTLTITSTPDENGRTKDLDTYEVGVDELHAIPPLKSKGWVQADGKVHLAGSHAELVIGILGIPANIPI